MLAKNATYAEKHHNAYISNPSNLWLAIFLQQLRTTRAYFMRPHLLIVLSCVRHTLHRCTFLVVLGIAIAKQLYGKSKKPTNKNEEFVTQYVCW